MPAGYGLRAGLHRKCESERGPQASGAGKIRREKAVSA